MDFHSGIQKIKHNSLRFKIIIWFLFSFLVLISGLISYTAVLSYRGSIETEKENIKSSALELSWQIKAVSEDTVNKLVMIDELFKQALSPLDTLLLNRDQVDKILLAILNNNEEYAGVFTCWLPDAFDGRDEHYKFEPGYDETGRFSRYWFHNSYGIPDVVSLAHSDDAEIIIQFPVVHHVLSEGYYINTYNRNIGDENKFIISFIYPVYHKDVYRGMVGIDYLGEAFIDNLHENKSISEPYCSSLFSSEGRSIIENSLLSFNNINDCGCENESILIEQVADKSDSFFITDKDKFIYFKPVVINSNSQWWVSVSVLRKLVKENIFPDWFFN